MAVQPGLCRTWSGTPKTVFSRRGSIGVCNEVRIHQSVNPINRLTREKVLIMKTDELLRRCIYICRVFTFSSCFMHPLWKLVVVDYCSLRKKPSDPTIPPTTMTMRLTSAMKMTLPTDSRSLHRRRIPTFVGFRRRQWLTMTLRLWWYSWWFGWILLTMQTVLFRATHLFKKGDLIMS